MERIKLSDKTVEIPIARATKIEFIEDGEGRYYCPECESYDLDQFGFDGFECNNCGLRIS